MEGNFVELIKLSEVVNGLEGEKIASVVQEKNRRTRVLNGIMLLEVAISLMVLFFGFSVTNGYKMAILMIGIPVTVLPSLLTNAYWPDSYMRLSNKWAKLLPEELNLNREFCNLMHALIFLTYSAFVFIPGVKMLTMGLTLLLISLATAFYGLQIFWPAEFEKSFLRLNRILSGAIYLILSYVLIVSAVLTYLACVGALNH